MPSLSYSREARKSQKPSDLDKIKIGVASESEEKARTKHDRCWDTQNIHRASTPTHNTSQSITSSLSIDTIHRLPPTTTHTEKSQERQGISRLLRKNKVARRVYIWSGTAVCAMFGLGLVFLSTGLIPVIPLDGSVTGLGYDGHNRTGILAEINANLTRIYNPDN